MSKNNVGNSLVRSHMSSLPSRMQDQGEPPLLKCALFGSLLALLATALSGLILISVMTAIAYADPDPLSKIPALSLVALLPSMFVGGFVCVKIVKEAPLLCGILSGAVTAVVFLVLSLILRGLPASGHAALGTVALHSAAVLFSLFGALAGNVKRRTKKRRFG